MPECNSSIGSYGMCLLFFNYFGFLAHFKVFFSHTEAKIVIFDVFNAIRYLPCTYINIATPPKSAVSTLVY